jgi:hypothetical protein
MASRNNPSVRRNDIIIQEIKGEILIYDLKINKAYCLNETATLVYQLCDGNNSIPEISKRLSGKLKAPVTEDFVHFALAQLKQDDLLDNSREIITNFEGLSRREVIRKIGFASIVALPVISSLVAPTAASAQSGICGCVNPGDCLIKTTCPSQVNCNLNGQCSP